MSTTYEIAILGSASPEEREALTTTIGNLVASFGLNVGRDVMVFDARTIRKRNRRAAFAATYFGSPAPSDVDIALHLVNLSAPVIPTVKFGQDFANSIPVFLRHLNGYFRRDEDGDQTGLATALLECVGLLRRQRRVFVSYRRVESSSAALQLHDQLTARGFDVFLDTHDVRPGDVFQDVLWHRLCDSDVMIMLDTKTYFESKWTKHEFARARAKEIHILRVVWPEHRPSRLSDMAETIYLDPRDFSESGGQFVAATTDRIALAVENLRSRSIASRNLSMTGRLRAEVERIGGAIEGVGAHRALALRLPDDRRIWGYPIVGVPTAELLHDVVDKAARADQTGVPALFFDHVGISELWMSHLKWLGANIGVVKAVSVSEAAWALAAWDA